MAVVADSVDGDKAVGGAGVRRGGVGLSIWEANRLRTHHQSEGPTRISRASESLSDPMEKAPAASNPTLLLNKLLLFLYLVTSFKAPYAKKKMPINFFELQGPSTKKHLNLDFVFRFSGPIDSENAQR